MMGRKFVVSVLVVFISAAALAAGIPERNLLRDGFVLTGVDGDLSARGSKWFFKLSSDLSDGRGFVKAGSSLELLPSAGLEKIIADLNEHAGASYRLYNAIVTGYKGRNFIFVDYFLPLSKAEETTVVKEPNQPEKEKVKVTINEPNDAVVIPQEIINKLSTRRIIRTEKLISRLELKQDSILADRTGYIAENSDGRMVFVFDALGRNVPKVSLELLPCRTLERALQRQSVEPERLKFKISGIVSKYKGRYYLLLQQATQVYSYGNFGG